jgi:hypothetical protein
MIDATGAGPNWWVMASASNGPAELTSFTTSCAPGAACTLPVSSLDHPTQLTSVVITVSVQSGP